MNNQKLTPNITKPYRSNRDNVWLETIKDLIQSSNLTTHLQITDDREYLDQLDQQITKIASEQ